MSNKMQSASKEFRGVLAIPLVLRWTAGAPAIVQNLLNEEIALTDNGTGDVTLTFASASVAPLILAGAVGLGVNQVELQAAASTTVLRLLTGQDDGSATDPTDLHLYILKVIQN